MFPDEFSVAGAHKAGVLRRLVVERRAAGGVLVQRVVRVQDVVTALTPARARPVLIPFS